MILMLYNDVLFYLRIYSISEEYAYLCKAINSAKQLIEMAGIVERIITLVEFPECVRKDIFAELSYLVKPDLSSIDSMRASYLDWLNFDLPEEQWEWIYRELVS